MYYKKMEGKLCYLSPLNPNDFEIYMPWINDMEVGVGMFFPSKMVTPEKEKEVLTRLANSYNFAIVDPSEDKVIGNIGFPAVDLLNRRGEVGVFIGDKSYWGRGYGQDAMSLILDYGFNILNLHSISLKVYSFNKPAIRSYERAGFREAGRLRECKIIGGESYDEIIMDILDSEFKSPYICDILKEKSKES